MGSHLGLIPFANLNTWLYFWNRFYFLQSKSVSLWVTTCQQHVEFSHTWVQVDGCTQEVEGRCVLLHGQVNQTQVVQHFPVKGRQVVCPLQAADSLYRKRDWRQKSTAYRTRCKYSNDMWIYNTNVKKYIRVWSFHNRKICVCYKIHRNIKHHGQK